MKQTPIIVLAITLIGAVGAADVQADSSLTLERASFFGTSGDDDIQGACVAPDGTIYIVGNTGSAMKKVPGGVQATRLGGEFERPLCSHGFVAQLSPDGSRVVTYTEFGKGVVSLTTVSASAQGVYVAGYASAGLEQLLQDVPGLMSITVWMNSDEDTGPSIPPNQLYRHVRVRFSATAAAP